MPQIIKKLFIEWQSETISIKLKFTWRTTPLGYVYLHQLSSNQSCSAKLFIMSIIDKDIANNPPMSIAGTATSDNSKRKLKHYDKERLKRISFTCLSPFQ